MCEFVTIRAGEWTAEICPSFGMNAISVKVGVREILRRPASFEELKGSPYLYGMPLLFPANRTEGGKFTFDGKTYYLPLNEPERNNHIHGLMFDAPFKVVNQTGSSVEAEYKNDKERYPFPFLMKIRDEVTENGYLRSLSLTNTGKTAFPYTLAFHTTFKEPENMTVPVQKRFLCNENYIPTGKYACLTSQESMYNTGIKPKGNAITGFYITYENEATLDDIAFSVSERFDEWVLFNSGGDKGFVCIEPQAGEVNGLNHEGGAKIIAPGEIHTFELSITKKQKGEKPE